MLKNHKPIAETTLNVHQLGENLRILETNSRTEIMALEAKVSSQSVRIRTLEETETETYEKNRKHMNDLKQNIKLADSFTARKLRIMEDNQADMMVLIKHQADEINRIQQCLLQSITQLDMRKSHSDIVRSVLFDLSAKELDSFKSDKVCLFDQFFDENPTYWEACECEGKYDYEEEADEEEEEEGSEEDYDDMPPLIDDNEEDDNEEDDNEEEEKEAGDYDDVVPIDYNFKSNEFCTKICEQSIERQQCDKWCCENECEQTLSAEEGTKNLNEYDDDWCGSETDYDDMPPLVRIDDMVVDYTKCCGEVE